MQNIKLTSVNEYFESLPNDIRAILENFRNIIKTAAPTAEEVVSYGMPAFKQNGMLVYYAVWKSHIGFYPSGSGIKNFEKELSNYKTSKGAIQFQLDEPLPNDLISKIVKLRVKENEEKAALKKKSKSD